MHLQASATAVSERGARFQFGLLVCRLVARYARDGGLGLAERVSILLIRNWWEGMGWAAVECLVLKWFRGLSR